MCRKSLYRRSYKYNNDSIPHAVSSHVRGVRGEMVLILAITIAVSVIVLSVISTSLSNIQIKMPSYRSSSIVPEYRNVREEFDNYLRYYLTNVSDPGYIQNVFNLAEITMSRIETKYGNYFNANLEEIDDGNITFTITLSNMDTSINEKVILKLI